MKRIYITLLTICLLAMGSTSMAQSLSVVSVTTLMDDNTAVVTPRHDLNDNLCALVRVIVPAVKGLQIKGKLGVVETVYKQGEYLVYVPEGTKSISYQHSDYHTGEVVFADYGLKKGLKGGVVYAVTLAAPVQKQTASVVLSLSPSDAKVTMGDKVCPVTDGIATIECKPGHYTFRVSAPDYESKDVEVTVGNDLAMKYNRVNLQKVTTYVVLACNVKDATLYVDGVNYGTTGKKIIPIGKHNVRISARGYEDRIGEAVFRAGDEFLLDIQLKRASHTVKILLDSSIKSIDYRPIKKNTTEVELKPRKHKFNGKTINITPAMDGMSVSQIMK